MEKDQLVAGRYVIRRLLGRGGMGEVYQAVDQRLATKVALKRVPRELLEEPQVRRALVEEARILARLTHKRIVRLFDLTETEEGMFIVLEYVNGRSFQEWLREEPKLVGAALLRMVEQVSEGLEEAHRQGVVHRDLKPANLLVSLGQEARGLEDADWKVADFGLAKATAHSMLSGRVVGTPIYMAPEQFRGEAVGPETDVYALGLIVYQCLTGKLPTMGAEPAYFHVYGTPVPMEGVDARVNAVVMRALEKERGKRWAGVREFYEALRQAHEPEPVKEPEPERVKPPEPERVKVTVTADDRQQQDERRPRLGPLAAVLILGMAMVGAIGVMLWPKGETKQAAARVEQRREAETPPANMAPLGPVNGAPRVDVPPPVIESARFVKPWGNVFAAMAEPRLEATLRMRGKHVIGLGGDGTVYLDEEGAYVSAVKNGKLQWAYELGGYMSSQAFSDDGLLWIENREGNRGVFVFNAAGQGGMLVSGKAAVKFERKETAQCVGGVKPMLARAGWKAELDQDCANTPVEGRDGSYLVQTKSGRVYAVEEGGKLRWSAVLPCRVKGLAGGSNGVVWGWCEDELYAIERGEVKAKYKAAHGVSGPGNVDDAGGIVLLEKGEFFGGEKLVRVKPDGELDWQLDLPVSLIWEIWPGPDGKIYITSPSPQGAILVVVAGS
jgi:tRNA A-37 threonylcarbamoyl transferase component Bud32